MCPPSQNRRKNFMYETGLDDPSIMKQAFRVLDRDGDGRIAFSDLQDFFSSCLGQNMINEDIELMICVGDSDRNGSVDFEEFERLISLFMEEENGKKPQGNGLVDAERSPLKEVFRIIDRDGDGVVSFTDLKSFMGIAMRQPVREEDIVGMIEAAGGSVKSGVCYEDLVNLMTVVMING
eukprot:Gb_05636 [translate_table: standard]